MPANGFSRFFIRQDVIFRAKRKKGAPLKFCENGEHLSVFDALEQAWCNSKAVLEIATDDFLEVSLIRLDLQNGCAVVLLHRTDPSGLTQMYKHRRTKALREADRQEHESIATSSHMLIELVEAQGKVDTYNAVLEEAPGIPRTLVNKLFDLILSSFPYVVETENGEVDALTMTSIRGHASENIGDALDDSVIKSLTLVKPGALEGCDEETAKFKDQTLNVTLTAGRGQTLPLVGRIWKAAQDQDWQECRITVEMPEQEKSRIVSIGRGMEAAEALFVRAVPVQVAEAIPWCCERIHDQLVAQGLRVLRGELRR